MEPKPSIQGVITNSLESESRPINLSLEGQHPQSLLPSVTSHLPNGGEVLPAQNCPSQALQWAPNSYQQPFTISANRNRLPLKKAYRQHNSLQEVEHQCEASGIPTGPCLVGQHARLHSLQRQASFDLETSEAATSTSQVMPHANLSSMEVKAKLKECVLSRRRTQRFQLARSLSSQTSSFESTEGSGSMDSALRSGCVPQMSISGTLGSATITTSTSRKRSHGGDPLLTEHSSQLPHIKYLPAHTVICPSSKESDLTPKPHAPNSVVGNVSNHFLRKTSSEPSLIGPGPVLPVSLMQPQSALNHLPPPPKSVDNRTRLQLHTEQDWDLRQSSLPEEITTTEMFLMGAGGPNRSGVSLHNNRAVSSRFRRHHMRQCNSDEHGHHQHQQRTQQSHSMHPMNSVESQQSANLPVASTSGVFQSLWSSGSEVLSQSHLLAQLTQQLAQNSRQTTSTTIPFFLTPVSLFNKATACLSQHISVPDYAATSNFLHNTKLTSEPPTAKSPQWISEPVTPPASHVPACYSPVSSEGSGSRNPSTSTDVDWEAWVLRKDKDVVNLHNKTGVVCDPGMLLHHCLCDKWNESSLHPECPARLTAIGSRLQTSEVVHKCVLYSAPPVNLDLIRLVHGARHPTVQQASLMQQRNNTTSSGTCSDSSFTCHEKDEAGSGSCVSCPTSPNSSEGTSGTEGVTHDVPLRWWQHCYKHLAICGGIGVDSDTYWHPEGTLQATLLATGQLVSLVNKVWRKDLRNGFALVRPPGHHAEAQQALGYCYVNHVAVACASLLQQQQQQHQIEATMTRPRRVLLVDWDVHHGNGTQAALQASSEVLYISLHRHEEGSFFPGTGTIMDMGQGAGRGYTVNIPWSSAGVEANEGGGLGDAEYMAAFRTVVLPVARAFQPQIVLVSAGFDAAEGHPESLGGYHVSPGCFAWMTQQLSAVAEDGRLVLSLEGGYHLESLSSCVHACVEALVASAEKELSEGHVATSTCSWCVSEKELNRIPCPSAQRTLLAVMQAHADFWPCLRSEYLRSDVGQSMAQSESNKQLTQLFACLHVHNR